jgi:RNA polymerase sigma factor (sigma-70 family)
MVLAYLRRLVPREEAEDVLQQVFLEAWQHRDRFEEGKRLEPWLLAIARRRAIDALRRQSRHTRDLEAVARAASVEDAAHFAAVWAEGADVRSALAQLSQDQREPLVLAYFEGLSQREISERLDQPLGTIKARMARGMRALAATLLEGEDS